MNYKELWTRIGYSQEDLYFEKINQELIKEMKSKDGFSSQTHEAQSYGKVLQFKPRRPETSYSKATKKAA